MEIQTKKQKNKETKKQRNKETKKQRNEETKKQRNKETKKQRNKETKKQRNKETKKTKNKKQKNKNIKKTNKYRSEFMRMSKLANNKLWELLNSRCKINCLIINLVPVGVVPFLPLVELAQ